MKKYIQYLFKFSFVLLIIACQNSQTLTKEQISTVTKEHQMIYVWSLSGILNQENGMSNFIFGGEEKNSIYTESYKASLKESWGISNKKDLLDAIKDLQNGNMHHQGFVKDYDGFFEITEAKFQKTLTDIPEYRNIHNVLWNNKALYKEKGILAWDIVRSANLIGWGYHAKYITMDEAYDLSIQTGLAAQKNFDSYDQLIENYLTGYLYWSEDYNEYTLRSAIAKGLLENPESAWNTFPFDYDMNKK